MDAATGFKLFLIFFEVTSLIVHNALNISTLSPTSARLLVVSPRDPYWALFCSFYILMMFTCLPTFFLFCLYADDTTILYSNKNIHSLFNIVNSNLISTSQYFAANKLSINHEKCSFILFRSPQKSQTFDPSNFKIYIDNHEIPNTDFAKFLGVYLDSALNWKKQISQIENKVSKSLGIILRLSSFVPRNVLRILYCSLILPYLSYCNIVWGNTYSSNFKSKLQIIQKKAIRIISGILTWSHSSSLFSNLNFLKLTVGLSSTCFECIVFCPFLSCFVFLSLLLISFFPSYFRLSLHKIGFSYLLGFLPSSSPAFSIYFKSIVIYLSDSKRK
ncbi:uncharacterized protein LOC117125389 [Anneissia japonica]|uniref:uncharacterized protein LOC117125389 n=1 Tax=Anneissia japonica TaxID=1529436 RepID=UPI0014255A16|nr:uncharacterized protein LOC117125389 [Anneissia japonica]